MSRWNEVVVGDRLEKTAAELRNHGFEVFVVENGDQAKKKALELIPVGAEVMTASSVTVDSIGLSAEINDSGRYDSVKKKQFALDREKQAREIRKLVSSPDYVVGSAHAVTETGVLLIASLTGSQLASHAFGAGTMIYVVGSNKVVPTLEAAYQRLNEHVLPLESARARKAYGLPDSFNSYPSKILQLDREVNPARVKVILVKEVLGF